MFPDGYQVARASGNVAPAPTGSDAEFMRYLGTVPERERAGLLAQRMRQDDASDMQIATGVTRLATAGINALNSYLRGEYEREIATARAASITAQERERQQIRTERAEVALRDLKLRIDRERALRPEANDSSGGSGGGAGAWWLVGAAGVVGVLVLVMGKRKEG